MQFKKLLYALFCAISFPRDAHLFVQGIVETFPDNTCVMEAPSEWKLSNGPVCCAQQISLHLRCYAHPSLI